MNTNDNTSVLNEAYRGFLNILAIQIVFYINR